MITRSRTLLIIALALMPPWVQAQGGPDFFGGGQKYTSGVVYKQGLVVEEASPNGGPAFALYNPDSGDFVEPLAYPGAEGEPYTIGNLSDYQAAGKAYNDFLESLTVEERAVSRVLSMDEYAKLDAKGYEKGRPLRGSRSVRVFDPDKMTSTVQLNAGDGLLLFQSRFDLNELQNAESVYARSLLFSDQGRIAASSDNTIGYRVAYIKPDPMAIAIRTNATVVMSEGTSWWRLLPTPL